MEIFTLRKALVWIAAFGPHLELAAARESGSGVESTRCSARTLLTTLTPRELARPARLRVTSRGAGGGIISDATHPLGRIDVLIDDLPPGETDDLNERASSVESPAFVIMFSEADPEARVQETVTAHAQALAISTIPQADEPEHSERRTGRT